MCNNTTWVFGRKVKKQRVCKKTAALENVNSTFQRKQGSESKSSIVLVCCEDKRTPVISERQNRQADKTASLNNVTTA